jgi:hypothetical protein
VSPTFACSHLHADTFHDKVGKLYRAIAPSTFPRTLPKTGGAIIELRRLTFPLRLTRMPTATSAKSKRSTKKSQPELSEKEQRELLDRANQIREQRAETQLELAKLFVKKKKHDVALRRLKVIVAEFSGTGAADQARALIRKL